MTLPAWMQDYALTVTGVLRDLPHNTQLIADAVMPNTSRADGLSAQEKASDWRASDGDYGYLELLPNAKPEAVAAAIGPLLDRAFDYHKYGLTAPVSHSEIYSLTSFRDVHLTSDEVYGMRPAGSWAVVYGLSVIALLIVLVACCNFMNLTTARATLRVREIAVRKVAGAARRQLIAQFLADAVVSALVSLVIALSLVEVLLPAFGRFLGEPISLHYRDWRLLAELTAGAVVRRAAERLLSGSRRLRSAPGGRTQARSERETGVGTAAFGARRRAIRHLHRPRDRGRRRAPADRFRTTRQPWHPARRCRRRSRHRETHARVSAKALPAHWSATPASRPWLTRAALPLPYTDSSRSYRFRASPRWRPKRST